MGSYFKNIKEELFIEGFYNSCILINERFNFDNIIIDELNYNFKLLEDVKKYKSFKTISNHYYYYNKVPESFSKKKLLLLL